MCKHLNQQSMWNGHGVRSISCLELEMKSETIRCTLILTGGYVCE